MIEYDVFRSAKDFTVFDSVDPAHCFNRTTCTRGYFTPETPPPDPEVPEIRPGFGLKIVQLPFSGKLSFSPLALAPPPEN